MLFRYSCNILLHFPHCCRSILTVLQA